MSRVANPLLKVINLRVLKPDIATARQEARREGLGYQHVLRRWISEGASRARGAKRRG